MNEAMDIAMNANHIWLGMVINNLADLHCMDRQADIGLNVVEQSLEVSRSEFGEEDWRSKRATITYAYCRVTAGLDVSLTCLGLQTVKVKEMIALKIAAIYADLL